MHNIVYVVNVVYFCVLLISKYLKIMFTITKSTQSGIQEVLTENGFRTREVVKRDQLEKLWFTKEEGTKKVLELRKLCRLTSIKKSIILNYS